MQKFEHKGIWRLPENPDRTVAGILTFDPNIGGFLHLIGSFKDITAVNDTLQPEIVQGITTDGRLVTLYKCVESNSSFSAPGFLSTIFYVHMIFIGVNFVSADNIKFKTMSVNFSYLDKWIDFSGFDKPQIQAKELQIKYKSPNTVKWGTHQNFTIALDLYADYNEFNLNNYGLPREIHINQRYYFRITPSEEKGFDEYLRIVRILANFLSFAISTPIYPLFIKATTEANKTQMNNKTVYLPVQIFFSLSDISDRIQEKSSISDVLFSYEEVSDWIETIIIKWFEKADILEPIHELYFGSLYNTRMYLYHSFSSLVQAIESYHRRVFPHEKELPEEVHNQRIKEIIDCIDNREYKDWLAKNLEHSNEINLRKRLCSLIKSYPIIRNLFSNRDEINSFINKVVDTRNYLTHYDQRIKEQAGTRRFPQKHC